MDEDKFTGLYDPKEAKVGCVLLQAGFGGTLPNDILHRFDDWLTFPTPSMQKFTGTREQWLKLAEVSNKGGAALVNEK